MYSPAVLRVRDLTKRYGGRTVLDAASLELRQGDVVLLLGDNGCGKTTFLNCLSGLVVPDFGTIDFPGLGVYTFSSVGGFRRRYLALRRRLSGFVGLSRSWQETRLIPSLDVLENLLLAVRAQKAERLFYTLFQPKAAAQERAHLHLRAALLLEDLGLAHLAQRRSGALSLGQARRASFARTIMADSPVVCLDEPMAGLDNAGARAVCSGIQALASRKKVSFIVVEHHANVHLLMPLVNRIATLRAGRISEEPQRRIVTRGPQAGAPPATLLRMIGCEASEVYMHAKHALPNAATLTIYRFTGVLIGAESLRVHQLVVHRGKKVVLGATPGGHISGLSFQLRRGELALLEAPNGWGKTTLLHALAGLLKPTAGRIMLNGRDLNGARPWSRRRLGLCYLRASGSIFEQMRVRQALMVAGVGNVPTFLIPLQDRYCNTLSGGEQQLLAITCALQGPPFLFAMMDEPLTGLDEVSVTKLSSIPNLAQVGVLVALPSRHTTSTPDTKETL